MTCGRDVAAACLELHPLETDAAVDRRPIALGALAIVALPREEEPQIIVPMVDVLVAIPGATPRTWNSASRVR